MSIGVPVFNGERYLEEALSALVRQTFFDLEIIVCDNASTDNTSGIARQFAAEDERIRYVRHPKNLGGARNFDCALQLARGTYFRWAAADDLSARTHVARCLEVLEAEPGVVLAYPRTQFIDAYGGILLEYEDRLHLSQERPSDRFDALLRHVRRCNAIFGLMRTNDLRACRPLGSYQGSDIVLLGELALRGRFHEVQEVLFSRRFHRGAASAMDAESRNRHFDPSYDGAPSLREWKLLAGNLRNAGRVPISAGERIRTAGIVMRRGVWERNRLAAELAGAARYYVRRRTRTHSKVG